jgi:hypothetical protein
MTAPTVCYHLRHRVNLKQRLIAAGLKEPRCEICGIDS